MLIVGDRHGQSLRRRKAKQLVDLRPIHADAQAGQVLEAEPAAFEEAVQRPDPWVGPTSLDPGDRLLRNTDLGRQLTLGEPGSATGVTEHPTGHRHVRLHSS